MARMKRKRQVITSVKKANTANVNLRPRFHYGWLQLEIDKANKKGGTRTRRKVAKCDRAIRLIGRYEDVSLGRTLRRQALFKLRANVYKTIEYNTFAKNGILKLTEIELYFMSSYMTKATSSEWALVYLGVGNGERFRSIRDDFFPELAVIAFDPLDPFFDHCRGSVEETAARWGNDGSNFTFLVRCFDPDTDVDWMKQKLAGRRLLFISDIRGMNLADSGTSFDRYKDQDEQWKAIQVLRPEKSLCKFTMPGSTSQWYTYTPGVLLKQCYSYYGSAEVRLLIDGVPEHSQCYNVWEVSEKLQYHHTHLRGQVFRSSFRPGATGCRCLDSCFDCTVLWNTASMYARKNSLDPYDVLRKILVEHGYDSASPDAQGTTCADMMSCLMSGRLMEAVAVLDGIKDNELVVGWPDVINRLWSQQPDLARRLTLPDGGIPSRGSLIRALGSLSEPFTLVRSELNGLLEYPKWSWNPLWQKYFAKQEAEKGQTKSVDLDMCWYFAKGNCLSGDQCAWVHERKDVSTLAKDDAAHINSTDSGK